MAAPGSVAEYREVARRRLPAPIFHYADGGADDERTLATNERAFARLRFAPRVLVDVSAIDTRARLFGREISFPLMLSPTGMSRLFGRGKELAVARAAARAGVSYGLSTVATTSLEQVAEIGGPRVFQIYIFKDRELTREFVVRCRSSGYDALCLTVDTPLAGNRERDRRTGMTMPPRFTLSSLWSFATHPGWALDFLRDRDFTLANVAHRANRPGGGSMGLIDYMNGQLDRSVTWDDAEWLAREWGGPFAIKGVLGTEDALMAQRIGATAVILSNHGGRQLDDAPAPIEVVEEIRAAVGPAMEIIVEGGIRRGADIAKAVCLGANACATGRPYLWGLAADGERGVSHVINILHRDLERTMALLGRPDLSMLTRDALHGK